MRLGIKCIKCSLKLRFVVETWIYNKNHNTVVKGGHLCHFISSNSIFSNNQPNNQCAYIISSTQWRNQVGTKGALRPHWMHFGVILGKFVDEILVIIHFLKKLLGNIYFPKAIQGKLLLPHRIWIKYEYSCKCSKEILIFYRLLSNLWVSLVIF